MIDAGTPRWDEEESADSYNPDVHQAQGIDLSPREGTIQPGTLSAGRRILPIVIIVVVVAALGLVLVQGLNDAAMFYYNVDEVVAREDDLAGQRVRMQGNVIDGSVNEVANGVAFTITFNDAVMEVEHSGELPELFKPDIPVILEGEYRDGRFYSDEILIRHDNTYEEEHQDRIRDAEEDVEVRQGSAG